MDPKLDKVVGFLDGFGLSNEQALEDVSQVSHVELVMKIDSGLSEVSFNFSVESQCCLDYRNYLLLDCSLEL